MNNWLQLALVTLTLCVGAACGTVRAPHPTVQSAGPLTPAFSPVGSEGGEARDARAGDLQSPPQPVAGSTVGDCEWPAGHFQKWNPIWWFGNVDDPEPPAWYRPGSPNRRWPWQLRNPLHNLTFYVIGIADKPFTRTGKFPQAVFAPDGGWNWAVAKHKWVRLPFVSFNGECWRFYLGWRERGNFGAKINIGKLPAADPKPQMPDPNPK